jgi:hypothetical protein
MSRSELKTLLDSEKISALAAIRASVLSSQRDDALMYYNNDMSKDMPAADGHSSAVSSDVSDTIEGLMPSLMEIFTGSEEVVKFNPQGPEDVQAAEQETDYINHVLMNQNPGFLILYSFIKDALLSKVGVVKVWWEEREEEEQETYYNLTDDQFALLAADQDVEIVAHSAHQGESEGDELRDSSLGDTEDAPGQLPQTRAAIGQGESNNGSWQPRGGQTINRSAPPGALPAPSGPPGIGAPAAGMAGPAPTLHDVKVKRSKKYAEAKVLGVPPEEFGIEKTARSIRSCNYCFHRITQITQGELIRQGYDRDIVESLPTYLSITNPEEINRDTVAEHLDVGEEHNPASRRIAIIEHYVRMDYEGTGVAKLYKVTTGDEQGVLLTKNGGELDMEEFDQIPFAAMTPVIITHRFFGRSLADLVMEIQRIKTALLRAYLDNKYLANNPRTEVAESHASVNTLDDLLISRQGGIVRTKQPGGLNVIEVPDIGQNIFPALEYFDQVREVRTGVTRQGQGIDADALQNQTATAVNQMYSATQARMKLIARIFAETGIKDLSLLLHGIVRKHGQQAQTVRLRNQWVQVDPREWKKRNDMTVEVGLGTGGKAEQMQMINLIIAMQEKALMGGLTNIVTPTNLYNSAKVLTRISGHKDTDAFFTDPSTQPPPQAQPDPKLQIEMIKAQSAAQLQQQKQQTEAVHEAAKLQADAALEQQKFEHQKELDMLEMHMKREEHGHKMQLATHQAKLAEVQAGTQIALAGHQVEQDKHKAETEKAKASQPKESSGGTMVFAGDKGAESVSKGFGGLTDSLGGGIKQLGDHMTKMHEQTMQAHKQTADAIGHMLKHASAPRKIVRGKDGKISHVETSH